MLKLDLINTVACGGAVLCDGHGIRRLIPPLARYNFPAPVIGGLLVALIVAQVALIAAVCWPLFYMMVRDDWSTATAPRRVRFWLCRGSAHSSSISSTPY